MIPLVLVFSAVASIVSSGAVDYSSCGKGKGCLYLPPSCSSTPSTCEATLTHMKAGQGKVAVEMTARKPATNQAYVAVGFSKDAKMGEDYVIHCISGTGTTSAKVTPAHNPDHHSRTQNIDTNTDVISSVSSEEMNGLFICRFHLSTSVPSEFTLFRSLNEGLRIFLATGPTDGTWPNRHNSKTISPNEINFAQPDLAYPEPEGNPEGEPNPGSEPQTHAEHNPAPEGKAEPEGEPVGEPSSETEPKGGVSAPLFSALLALFALSLLFISN